MKNGKGAFGFNAATEEYEDLVKAGVIDPTKVVRTALQNAARVAALLLTTEAMIAEKPSEEGTTTAARPAAWAAWAACPGCSPGVPLVEMRKGPWSRPVPGAFRLPRSPDRQPCSGEALRSAAEDATQKGGRQSSGADSTPARASS